MSSRRRSNSASPLINPQRQITSFFAKATCSPSPSPIPKSNSIPGSATPSPLESKPTYGEEVVGKRIKVLWPADRAWYKGCVKSFNKEKGRHLIQYDDGDEEESDLSREKFAWLQDTVTNLKRLRRGPLPTPEAAAEEEEEKEESHEGDDDDSGDEDMGKSVEKEVVEEEEDEGMEVQDEEDSDEGVPKSKGKGGGGSGKQKLSGGGNLGSAKKTKSRVMWLLMASRLIWLSLLLRLTAKAVNGIKIGDDASERFSMREAERFRFLGEKRRDAKKRCPGDVDYDPRTLYLPPDFLKSLSGGQRQWWEFKSKHMDKVLFFKMAKFYELFEMESHIGAKELDLQYMKGEQHHCGYPEKKFSMNVEKLARKGYRVLVIEQTETPEQMEVLCKEGGSKDKVVKREVCAVVTKGTLTEGEMLSANPDASYLTAVTETSQNLANKNAERVFGVCVVDTSRVILGQFPDDLECSSLSCLLSESRPVELVKPAELLSPEAEKVLLRHTRNPLVNELVPLLEFWDAEKNCL